MAQLKGIFLAAPVFLILLLTGCGHGSDALIAQQATRSGVYAFTATGLLEITQYGAATVDPFSQEIQFKFDHPTGQIGVTAPVTFVTNLPDAVIADSKVFLLPALDAGRWHKYFVDGGDSKPLSSSSDQVSGSIYKVVPDLPNSASGFLCLWVKMPKGTDDRLYAVHLK